MAHEHDRLSGIVGVEAPEGSALAAQERRAKTRIRRLHHHAMFTKDAEATRHFYEDILEMKLIVALVDEGDISPTSPAPLLHIFFEMGDGGMLAFFDARPIHGHPEYSYPKLSVFDHHLSVHVDDRETQLHFKRKLEADGHKVMEIDHGFCISIYADDPNGIHMEISCNTEEFDDHMLRAEQVSHDQLSRWIKNRAGGTAAEGSGREVEHTSASDLQSAPAGNPETRVFTPA